MTVINLAPRRGIKVAITLSPPPEAGIPGAEYEGEKLLIDRNITERCSIIKGTELSAEEVRELIFVSECYRAKKRAIWLLSGQDYSEKKLYRKLLEKFTPKAAAFAISQMISRGYLSDERFATALVAKCKAKNMSCRKIAEKLMENGISKELSDSLLRDNQELREGELHRAVALIKSKYINKISNEEDKKRTFSALLRRGFSYSDIKKAMELSLGEDSFDEEIY